jgi:arsenate reductase
MLLRGDGSPRVNATNYVASPRHPGESRPPSVKTEREMGILPNCRSKDPDFDQQKPQPSRGCRLTRQILFVCVENAGRSQMAEGFARAYGLTASSAGAMPAEEVNPVVVEAMKEKGIALPGKPRMLREQMIRQADLVVTMGCSVQEVCPRPLVWQMEKKIVDWHIEDPKGKPIHEVRKIRDQIESKVMELLKLKQEAYG